MRRVFVDTNVLVYGFDRDESVKRELSWKLQADPDLQFVLSTQVLIEFYNVATRRLAIPLDPPVARQAVAHLCRNEIVSTDGALVESAISLSIESQISIWDALIVTAARTARCDWLLTEDLQDGALIAGVRIENPFKA